MSSLQLGIRLHDTVELPIEERIAEVHRLGFSCGHLALGKMKDAQGNTLPNKDEMLTPGYAMYLRHIFEENHVDVAVLGNYLNLANPNREQLEKITHRYMAHLRFASYLGAGMVGTETGAPNETYTTVPECYTEEALNTFITNLRPVVRYAEQWGVMIAIEPVIRHIVCNPGRARRVLDEIGSPNLQIIFDPVNLLDESNYRQREEIFQETMDLLGEDIAMIHLKDFAFENGKMISLGCGLGEMDYTSILRFMKERKPYVHATLEDTRPDNALACAKHIRDAYEAL